MLASNPEDLIKNKLKSSYQTCFFYNDNINEEDLSASVDAVKDCQGAMKIIKECKNIKTNKRKIICFAYEQGKIFKKFKRTQNLKIALNNSK